MSWNASLKWLLVFSVLASCSTDSTEPAPSADAARGGAIDGGNSGGSRTDSGENPVDGGVTPDGAGGGASADGQAGGGGASGDAEAPDAREAGGAGQDAAGGAGGSIPDGSRATDGAEPGADARVRDDAQNEAGPDTSDAAPPSGPDAASADVKVPDDALAPSEECRTAGGVLCTANVYELCPTGFEPIRQHFTQRGFDGCPKAGERIPSWCCQPAPASDCSNGAKGNCVIPDVDDCWVPLDPLPGCEEGRVCSKFVCEID